MRFALNIFLPLGFLFFAACSQSTGVSAPTQGQVDSSLRVTVLSQNSVIADGFSDLIVTALIEDLLGNKLISFTPSVGVKAGSLGVNFSSCTVTDSLGQTTCTFRSTLGGSKNVLIGGRTIAVEFIEVPANLSSQFAIVASAQFDELAGTDFVSSTIGATFDQPRQEFSGWLLRTDIAVQY